MVLVEREAVLARVERALDRARAGQGGIVVVSGVPGIGKSAVLAAVRAGPAVAGMRILRARGAELEGEFGFGVVRQLFEPLLVTAGPGERARWLAGPAALAAHALGLPLDGAAPAAAPDPSFAVPHGLYWLCANLAAEQPLCLMVDDAHWADAPSLRFLAFLQPRLEELPVALVVATRPGEGAADGGVVATLAADAATELVQPEPLSPHAVARLAEEALGTAPDPAFTAACHRATGGVPFLVGQLLRAVAEEGSAPVAGAVERVERLGARWAARWILVRLGRLPEPAVQLARALAVLEAGELAEAAAVAGLPADVASGAADALVAAGLIRTGRPLRFVHPVVRRGIYDELGAGARADAHRRAAAVLAGAGAPGERVAEHLLATHPAGDAWAAEQLRAAAATAVARGAPDVATTLLRRALAEPPAAGERPGVQLELGTAALAAGRPEAIADLEAAFEQAAESAGRLRAGLVLTNAYGVLQRFGDGLAVLDRLAGVAAGDPPLARLLETTAVGVAMLDAGTAGAARPRIRAARERADDPAATRDELALAAVIAGQAGEPADRVAALAERAWEAGGRRLPEPADLPWFEQMTVALTWAERPAIAGPMLDAAVGHARVTAEVRTFASACCCRGMLALHRGDLQTAELDLRTALDSHGLRPPPLYRTLISSVLVEVLAERGELEEAERLVALLPGEPERSHSIAANLRLARARLRLARQRPGEAHADAIAAGEVAVAMDFSGPGWMAWRPVAALAAMRAGDAAAAGRQAAAGVALARRFGAPRTLGVALHAAGVVAGGAEGERLLRAALAAHQAAGARLEQARALTELGAALRRVNRRAEARDLLREGLDLAARLGARPLAERAEVELRATGARPRRVLLSGVEALTASERRVAELAAAGLGNREIAQELFVTARTVEGHLTSVFRKLDLASRAELPAVLAGEPVAAR